MNKLLKILPMLLIFSTLGCNLSPKVDTQEITPKQEKFSTFSDKNPDLYSKPFWKEFGDKNLDNFVNLVKENSIDLKNTALTVEKFKYLYRISESSLWPNIYLTTGAVRSKSNLGTFLPQGGSFKKTNYSFAINLSYEADIFSKLSNRKKEAYYSYLNTKATQNSVRLSIIADAINFYLKYAEIEQEISLTEQLLKTKKLMYNSALASYTKGVFPSEIYLGYFSSLKQTENDLAQLKSQKNDIEKSLKVILSDNKAKIKFSNFEKISGKLPPLKPGLPSELLLRRPDINAAYYKIKTQVATIGEKKAELFPSIAITGSDGYQSTDMSILFTQASNVWNFGINLLQPIFNRGALKNQVKISEKDLEIAINNYKKTVINAFAEVDQLLNRQKLLEKEIENHNQIVSSLKLTEKKKFKDYLAGYETYENYLNSRANLIMGEITLNRLYLAYFVNRISLYKALGGGVEKINLSSTEVKK